MMKRPLAANAHTRRHGRLRATRAHPEGCCVVPIARNPEGLRPSGRAGGHPEVSLGGSWLRPTPASWRAGLGPDSHRSHRDDLVSAPKDRYPLQSGDRRSGAGAPGVRLVAAHPTQGGDSSRAPKCPCRDGPQPIPGVPDRSRVRFRSFRAEALPEPRPVQPGRAVIRTCRWSRQRTFPKIRSSR